MGMIILQSQFLTSSRQQPQQEYQALLQYTPTPDPKPGKAGNSRGKLPGCIHLPRSLGVSYRLELILCQRWELLAHTLTCLARQKVENSSNPAANSR